jgi:predicted HicB family RNase H-like nuclease
MRFMPVRKPTPHSNDTVNTHDRQGIDTVNDKAANQFIKQAAKNSEASANNSKRKKKTQMMMRIDTDLLVQIDERAAREGISRSAWISQSCALRLNSNL